MAVLAHRWSMWSPRSTSRLMLPLPCGLDPRSRSRAEAPCWPSRQVELRGRNHRVKTRGSAPAAPRLLRRSMSAFQTPVPPSRSAGTVPLGRSDHRVRPWAQPVPAPGGARRPRRPFGRVSSYSYTRLNITSRVFIPSIRARHSYCDFPSNDVTGQT